MLGSPGITPEQGSPHANKAVSLNLAQHISRDILRSRSAGHQEPAFYWLLREIIGEVDDQGKPIGTPPVFESSYGDRWAKFPLVVFSGFTEDGRVLHIRQPNSTGRYFSAVLWDPTVHQSAGEISRLDDMRVQWDPEHDVPHGAENSLILTCGPHDPALKLVQNLETGELTEVYVGKRVTTRSGEERFKFGGRPLRSLSVLVSEVEARAAEASAIATTVGVCGLREASGADA